MRWTSRSANRILFGLILASSGMGKADALGYPALGDDEPIVMSFTKGDTRNGSKIQLRIVGDSLYFKEITYAPNIAPVEALKTIPFNGHRRRALNSVMGELPRYPSFGSCYGRDMRFYMVETAEGKFYRSVPARSGKCYIDEPGIWSLFQDLDDLMTPPADLDFQEYSAS